MSQVDNPRVAHRLVQHLRDHTVRDDQAKLLHYERDRNELIRQLKSIQSALTQLQADPTLSKKTREELIALTGSVNAGPVEENELERLVIHIYKYDK